MDKTLPEHHYHYRIAALADDLTDRCARRLVVVETMAKELGWRHVCATEAIEIKTEERSLDALMQRTRRRPLPAGRLQPGEALIFAVLISTAGMVYLYALVNPLTSLLSAITFISYISLYTPLKTRTWLCTPIGAIPGALPAAMGWAAAAGRLSAGAWILFGIVFLWQLPHFYAIGWMYRDDYSAAGFPMLPVLDATGGRTSRQASLYILGLLGLSVLPSVTGMAGLVYLGGAVLLGLVFLWFGVQLDAPRLGEIKDCVDRKHVVGCVRGIKGDCHRRCDPSAEAARYRGVDAGQGQSAHKLR